MHRVYTLRDCEGNVRYVGRTRGPLALRLQQHSKHDGPVGVWIRHELASKRQVTIKEEQSWPEFYQSCSASSFERELISFYREQVGDLLLNRESRRNPLLKVESNG